MAFAKKDQNSADAAKVSQTGTGETDMTIAGIGSRQASGQIRENRESRALVVVTPAASTARPTSDRPRTARAVSAAPFLAHLVAMREQAPQTRTRRRAEPAEATRIYQSQTITAPVNGQQMSRRV